MNNGAIEARRATLPPKFATRGAPSVAATVQKKGKVADSSKHHSPIIHQATANTAPIYARVRCTE